MNRYRTVKRRGRSFSEHRLVWEKAHGPIPSGYVIHHKNGDTFDNRLENLEAMTHQAHSAHHNQILPETKRCASCGATYTPPTTKRRRSRTCSRRCFVALARQQKIGAKNPQAKLTATIVADARMRRGRGEALKALCSEYSVSPSALSQAVNGKTWKHVTTPPPLAAAVVAALVGAQLQGET